jgi:hypothetical protein
MGIRFFCPNGHKLNVKEFQAGRKGICPFCGAKIQIPTESTRPSSRDEPQPPGQPGSAPAANRPSGETSDDDSPSGAVSMAVSAPASQAAPPAAAPGPAPIVSAPLGPGPAFSSGPAESAPPVGNAAAPPPMTDPFTEAGEVVWYVRPPSGGQFGPAGGEVMRTWLAEGRVSADSLVWREGWRDWREAGGVFPQLRPEPSPAAFDPALLGGADVAAPAAHVAHAPHAPRPKPRRVRHTKEILIIASLVVAVLILVGVFLWVFLRPQ